MIKLFSKVRHRLINEGNLKKYLPYAIGEIALVVIGILIALQINNWNENRKLETIELKYLERLLIDLQFDTTYYTQRIDESEGVMYSNMSFIREAYKTQSSLEEAMNLLSMPGWDSKMLTTQNFTFVELTNSQNLNTFKNDKVKIAIISYYREVEEAAKHFVEWNTTSTRSLTDINKAIPNYLKLAGYNSSIYNDPKMFKNIDWSFVNDPSSDAFQTIENSVNIYYAKHSDFLGYFNNLKPSAQHLIDTITKELNSRQ